MNAARPYDIGQESNNLYENSLKEIEERGLLEDYLRKYDKNNDTEF
ncbi:hypothetical protein [Neobacillus sp. NPDC093127]